MIMEYSNLSSVGLRSAVQSHFKDVDKLDLRLGKIRVVVTNIYIDNIKAFSIKSNSSKIAACKICDSRIKAILNHHPMGIMFLNSKYTHIFGDSAESVINTLAELIRVAIPDCNDNRIRYNDTNRAHQIAFTLQTLLLVAGVLSLIPMSVHIDKDILSDFWIMGPISLAVGLVSKRLFNNKYPAIIPLLLTLIPIAVWVCILIYSSYYYW